MKIRLFNNQTCKYVGALDLEAVPRKDDFISFPADKSYIVTAVRFMGESTVDLAVSQIVNVPAVFAAAGSSKA